MSHESQEEPAGNTKTAGNQYQLYRYCVTLPYEEITASQLSQHLKVFCKSFTYQAEIGKDTDYKHWQIELSLKNKLRFQEFKNLLGFNKAHIEPTKNYFAAKNYCSKSDTRIEGPYTEKSTFIMTPECIFHWQQKLKRELLEHNGWDPEYYRKILIYIDFLGGAGKTDICTWFMDKYPQHTAYFPYGKVADMAYALPDDPKYIFFDVPRVGDERINYAAIELMKNGIIFSPKYESGFKRFNRPHVILMSNDEVDMTALSRDRYDLRYLSEEDLQEETF